MAPFELMPEGNVPKAAPVTSNVMKLGCGGLSACAVCDSEKQTRASGMIRNARRKGERLIGFVPFGVVVVDLNMFIVIFLFLLLTLSGARLRSWGGHAVGEGLGVTLGTAVGVAVAVGAIVQAGLSVSVALRMNRCRYDRGARGENLGRAGQRKAAE